jgi:hypothetical protein
VCTAQGNPRAEDKGEKREVEDKSKIDIPSSSLS